MTIALYKMEIWLEFVRITQPASQPDTNPSSAESMVAQFLAEFITHTFPSIATRKVGIFSHQHRFTFWPGRLGHPFAGHTP